MDSLPHEVLVHIFQFLPLSSRKRIRTTCKKFNTACGDPLITNRELFNINAAYQPFVSDVFLTLAESKQNILNLKFCEFPLDAGDTLFSENDVSSFFWRNRGTKVKYLEFSRCKIRSDIVAKILMCCANLNGICFYEIFDGFDNALKILLDDDMVMKRVTFLSITHFYEDIGFPYELLPGVFPNVQKLKIDIWISAIQVDFVELYESLAKASQHYVLTVSSNLQCLEFHTSSFSTELPPEILTEIQQINTLRLPKFNLSMDNILLIKKLKNLTELCICTRNLDFPVGDKLVQILNIFPRLRHLEVVADYQLDIFEWSSNVVNKIVTSSLQTLKLIDIEVEIDYENPFVVNTYNDTLETLHLLFRPIDIPDSILIPSIKYFRKLQNLSFGARNVSVSSRVLETLRNHQRNLNSLTANFKTEEHPDEPYESDAESEWNSNEYVGPHFFSFRQFENLEYLNLRITSYFWKQYSFYNFVLPQLRYLKINFEIVSIPEGKCVYMKQGNVVNLLGAIEKLPSLESLKLFNYPEVIPYEFVLRQVECHKNLQCLCIRNPERRLEGRRGCTLPEYPNVCRLFSVRESLRFVLYQELSLHKNVITKEIVEVSPNQFDLL